MCRHPGNRWLICRALGYTMIHHTIMEIFGFILILDQAWKFLHIKRADKETSLKRWRRPPAGPCVQRSFGFRFICSDWMQRNGSGVQPVCVEEGEQHFAFIRLDQPGASTPHSLMKAVEIGQIETPSYLIFFEFWRNDKLFETSTSK